MIIYLDRPTRTSLTWEEKNPRVYIYQSDPIFEELRSLTERIKDEKEKKDV